VDAVAAAFALRFVELFVPFVILVVYIRRAALRHPVLEGAVEESRNLVYKRLNSLRKSRTVVRRLLAVHVHHEIGVCK
jgi:hypothetical protein